MVLDITASIADSKQPIFRVVRVSPGISLQVFHEIIQALFGWSNTQDHYFASNSTRFGNEENIKLSEVFAKFDKIEYVYDISQSWLVVCSLIQIKPTVCADTPECIGGQLNSPPEDAGGIVGYDTALEYLKIHKEGKRKYPLIMEGYGDYFDPLHFSIDEVNCRLKNIVL